jgi:hypothetical protein
MFSASPLQLRDFATLRSDFYFLRDFAKDPIALSAMITLCALNS